MDEYRTVQREGRAVLVEKRSKFIAAVRPVVTEGEALAFINEMRSSHFNATHNVYAYAVIENNIQRYSDDGEPSGTAGIPVLEAIKNENLTNIAIVVTRYFGGTLLGTGGLARAYGAAARQGIEDAGPVTMALCGVYEVRCEYGMLGRLQYDITAAGHNIDAINYAEDVKLTVCVRAGCCKDFESFVADSSLGRAAVKKIGQKFVAIKN